MKLNQDQCDKIHTIAKRTASYWKKPLPGRFLHFESALIELSILSFGGLRCSLPHQQYRSFSEKRVITALKNFDEHFSENTSLQSIATLTGVSVSQLRRDFMSVLHISPKKAFNDIRLKRAMELLQSGGHSVEAIAEQCGFMSSSAFSRAFKNKFGNSPTKIFSKKK